MCDNIKKKLKNLRDWKYSVFKEIKHYLTQSCGKGWLQGDGPYSHREGQVCV